MGHPYGEFIDFYENNRVEQITANKDTYTEDNKKDKYDKASAFPPIFFNFLYKGI